MKNRLWVPIVTILFTLGISACKPAPVPATVPVTRQLPQTATSPSHSDIEEATNTALPPTNMPVPTKTAIPPTETAPPLEPTPVLLELKSGAFQAKQLIPVRHTCHGENLSPPLAWSQPPDGTKSTVLIMDDPDAVNVAGFVWDHWLLFNLPPDILSTQEGVLPDPELPDGSRHGQNSFKRLGYGGPCPPSGQTHRYVFKLYALDTILTLEAGASKDEILETVSGHVLAEAELVGLYSSP